MFRKGCVEEEKRLAYVSRCSLPLHNNRHGIKMMVFNCFIWIAEHALGADESAMGADDC